MYDEGSYRPLDLYHRPSIEELVDFLVSPELLSIGTRLPVGPVE